MGFSLRNIPPALLILFCCYSCHTFPYSSGLWTVELYHYFSFVPATLPDSLPNLFAAVTMLRHIFLMTPGAAILCDARYAWPNDLANGSCHPQAHLPGRSPWRLAEMISVPTNWGLQDNTDRNVCDLNLPASQLCALLHSHLG